MTQPQMSFRIQYRIDVSFDDEGNPQDEDHLAFEVSENGGAWFPGQLGILERRELRSVIGDTILSEYGGRSDEPDLEDLISTIDAVLDAREGAKDE